MLKMYETDGVAILVPLEMLEVLVCRSMFLDRLEHEPKLDAEEIRKSLLGWEFFPTALAVGAGTHQILNECTLPDIMEAKIKPQRDTLKELVEIIKSTQELVESAGVKH